MPAPKQPPPESVKDLADSLQSLRDQAAQGARREELDHTAARLVSALARFCTDAGALVPAQRALLLLASRPSLSVDKLGSLASALREVDAALPKDQRGFSRLLENALDSAHHIHADRVDVDGLSPELRSLGEGLSLLGRTLGALDDLSHALSASSELAAGAILADGLMDFALTDTEADDNQLVDEALAWLEHRGVNQSLLSLYSFRHALEELRDGDVERAVEAGVARPLALWVLSERLTLGVGLDGPDRPHVERLVEAAGLLPLEVFDAANLWADLDRREP